ncbi:MAG TPA: type VI secretion system tip protein TssI/VgrG [Planctomycetota bacterium]|nr:type VI secretion system tip protein TssI/VgrG [Planctomycetota bacterium]
MPIFMKISGAEGDLTGAGIAPHDDWIVLDKFTFGGGAGATTTGTGAEKTRTVDFGSTVMVYRMVDVTSPQLMNWVREGDQRTVIIHHCTLEGFNLYSLTLTGAELTKYDVNNQTEYGIPETLTLQWKGFELGTASVGADGVTQATAPGSPYVFEPAPQVAQAPTVEPEATPGEQSDKAFDSAGLAAMATDVADSVHTAPLDSSAIASNAILHSLTREDPRAPPQQVNRTLVVDEVNSKPFSLLSFHGSEGVSSLFEFTLELSSTEADIAAADIVGQKIGFRIQDVDGIESEASPDRNFHGRVRRFWAGEVHDDGSRRYRVTVVPWLWMLTKRSDCRVFQQKSVIEIVEQVFSDASFSDFEKGSVLETYPKLEYCVQYRETDFDFVSRLLEENGIFYFFRHEADKHVLVLADDKTVHTMCEVKDVVHSTGDYADKRVYFWEHRFEMVAKKSLLRDYNYLTPAENLQVEQPGSVSLPDNANLELFDYPGAYTKKADGDKLAKARIQAEEARYDIAVGRGNWDALEVGRMFEFKDHEVDAEVGKSYIVARIEHRADQFSDGPAPAVDYHSTFSCVPNTVLLRPSASRERPRIQGPQTAVVVGPAGEEIATDKYGRVKVQFHWDRKGKKDENSSCWLRVAQSIAGAGWGAQVLPRMGQEVLVQFLDGDPDRPLVVGTLYNETALPIDLPGKKNQTLLRTRSTKSGSDENFNELNFDDTKDSEKVYLHAEKDMLRVVENDDTLTIGKDGKGSRVVTIEKDSTSTVNKGNRVESLTEGSDTLTIEKGDRTVEIKTGKETVTIKGDRTVTIQSGKDVLEVTAGDQKVKLGGKGDIEAATGFTIKVTGGKVTIDASPGIELKAGSSTLTLGPSGIEMKGLSVKIEGSVESQVKAAMVTVEASGILKAKGGLTMLG